MSRHIEELLKKYDFGGDTKEEISSF